ncbi:MAG: C2 family cysteine protease [Candidatus Obscuribacterales bacterium]|jgi:hypothetical protein
MVELHRSHESSAKHIVGDMHGQLIKDWQFSEGHSKKPSDSDGAPGKKKNSDKDSSAKLENKGHLPKLELTSSTDGPAAAGAEASMEATLVRAKQTAPLEDGAFAKKSLAIFDRLDADKNGFISDKEAVAAMQDGSYVDDEAQTVAGLFKARQPLSRLHSDSSFVDYASTTVTSFDRFGPGVSRQDLEAYGAMQESQRAKLDGAYRAKNYLNTDGLKKVDLNADGQVSKEELSKQFASVIDEQEKKAIRYLVDNYDTIRGANTYLGSATISTADITLYSKNLEETTQSKAVREVSNGVYFTSQSQKPGVNYSLFADVDPLKSISPEAIQQRSIGDCYFEASLASLAKERPQDIAKMIKDNSDGTYTVTFPGAPSELIVVKAPTEAELGVYNAASEYGTWANVIEKAFGQYRQTHGLQSWSDWAFGKREQTPTDGADGGGPMVEAMNLLSERSSSSKWSSWRTEDTIANEIKTALSESRMVTAGTPGKSDKERLANGYPANHAYSVVGYREDAQGKRFITVRNPWGGSDKDGTSEVSIEEFRQTFDHYSVEEK